MKLIGIPYAGGSSASYIRWNKFMPAHIELVSIELPGRGRRFGEPLPATFEEAVNDIYEQVKPWIDDEEYAIFGHSMGSWLAYELYYKLLHNGHRLPVHMFVSGRRAPHLEKELPLHWNLPQDEMLELLKRYGGLQDEVLNDPLLLELVMPMIRSDFRITEQYVHLPKQERLACGMSVFAGKNDIDVPLADMTPWKQLAHSSHHCQVYVFAGNHFFIHDYAQEVVTAINKILLKNRLVG
ncbi:thioesterase [Paenibacillus sp. CCS19]|uniref:thioesterase II family protein n=1 Tax=Paenibacillus sp. CCS19 TaxID=3158387 RepID=UPI0025662065|nr:alpha/beta fold hydrolase [Paenibacillus cellulosilyticus]GMK38587.1 thioesterase [Paenibacillus cellulosilyticus]